MTAGAAHDVDAALRHVENGHIVAATFNEQLLLGTAMMALIVLIHGFGIFGLQRALLNEAMKERLRRIPPLSLRGSLFTLMTVFAIIAIHFAEIWLFALLYLMLGAIRNFPDALYFSTTTYSTVGYSDARMHSEWRMIAALEGILGPVLLGWSTAFFVRILGRLDDSLDTRPEG